MSKLRCEKCGGGADGYGSLQFKGENGKLVHIKCPENKMNIPDKAKLTDEDIGKIDWESTDLNMYAE